MIDLNLLKADPKIVAKQLNSKNYALNVSSFETLEAERKKFQTQTEDCLLYTSPSPRDGLLSRMPSSA